LQSTNDGAKTGQPRWYAGAFPPIGLSLADGIFLIQPQQILPHITSGG
jgi:hypothetical protein